MSVAGTWYWIPAWLVLGWSPHPNVAPTARRRGPDTAKRDGGRPGQRFLCMVGGYLLLGRARQPRAGAGRPRWRAGFCGSPMSLTATASRSEPISVAARRILRPMRPNPLIPILMFTPRSLSEADPAGRCRPPPPFQAGGPGGGRADGTGLTGRGRKGVAAIPRVAGARAPSAGCARRPRLRRSGPR